MSAGMILCINEPMNYFNRALSEHAGPAAFTVDALVAAEVILDKLFYGMALRTVATGKAGTIQGLISEYFSVPTEVLHKIAENFEIMIKQIVCRVVAFEPDRDYSYQILQNGDLVVTYMELDPAGTSESIFADPLLNDISDDYTPARLRR